MNENLNIKDDKALNDVPRTGDENNGYKEPAYEVLPCIPLRGVTVFPNTVVHFDVGREKSIRALERAMSSDKLLFVSTQKDDNILIPTGEDIYEVGTIVRIKQMLKIQGDAVRVLVEGISRGSVIEILSADSFFPGTTERVRDDFFSAAVQRIEEKATEETISVEDKARVRIIVDSFMEYAALTSHIADEVMVMYRGRVVEFGPKEAIYSQPLHPYTQTLLSASPSLNSSGKKNRIRFQDEQFNLIASAGDQSHLPEPELQFIQGRWVACPPAKKAA